MPFNGIFIRWKFSRFQNAQARKEMEEEESEEEIEQEGGEEKFEDRMEDTANDGVRKFLFDVWGTGVKE